jgi:hypothetical protein
MPGSARLLNTSKVSGKVSLRDHGLGVRARGSARWGKAETRPDSDASASPTRAGGRDYLDGRAPPISVREGEKERS